VSKTALSPALVTDPASARDILRAAGAWFHGDPIPVNQEFRTRLQQADKLAKHARELTALPGAQSHNHVRLRGGRLTRPIYWQGQQWAVTGYGVESRDGRYTVSRLNLWDDEFRHSWLRHMAEKNWVDLADFAEALRIARRHHAPRCGGLLR
jgi:hypothetical protein